MNHPYNIYMTSNYGFKIFSYFLFESFNFLEFAELSKNNSSQGITFKC